MSHQVKNQRRMLMLLWLAVAVAGCRQPEVASTYQQPWSERWTERLAKLSRRPQEPQTPGALASVPGPKADEQMTTAMMLEHDGEIDRAIDVYTEIVQKDNSRAEVHHRLAVLYDTKGLPDEALKHYKLALKKNSKNTNMLCDLGYHYYLYDQPKEAETQLRKVIEMQPSMGRAHNNLALVLARTGRPDEALVEFRRAGNNLAAAHVNMAYALMWDEHWEQASQHINEALAADPQSKVAKDALASLTSVVEAYQRGDKGVTQVDYQERSNVNAPVGGAGMAPLNGTDYVPNYPVPNYPSTGMSVQSPLATPPMSPAVVAPMSPAAAAPMNPAPVAPMTSAVKAPAAAPADSAEVGLKSAAAVAPPVAIPTVVISNVAAPKAAAPVAQAPTVAAPPVAKPTMNTWATAVAVPAPKAEVAAPKAPVAVAAKAPSGFVEVAPAPIVR